MDTNIMESELSRLHDVVNVLQINLIDSNNDKTKYLKEIELLKSINNNLKDKNSLLESKILTISQVKETPDNETIKEFDRLNAECNDLRNKVSRLKDENTKFAAFANNLISELGLFKKQLRSRDTFLNPYVKKAKALDNELVNRETIENLSLTKLGKAPTDTKDLKSAFTISSISNAEAIKAGTSYFPVPVPVRASSAKQRENLQSPTKVYSAAADKLTKSISENALVLASEIEFCNKELLERINKIEKVLVSSDAPSNINNTSISLMSPTFIPVPSQIGSPTSFPSMETKPELINSLSSPIIHSKHIARPASAFSGIRNAKPPPQAVHNPFFPKHIAPSLAAAESLVNRLATLPSSPSKKSLSIFANKSMILPPHTFPATLSD